MSNMFGGSTLISFLYKVTWELPTKLKLNPTVQQKLRKVLERYTMVISHQKFT